MATPGSPQIEGRDRDLPTLDALIQILVAFEAACIFPPAQIAICSTTALLNIIRDTKANKQDFVDLGRHCGHVCRILHQALNGKRPDELGLSVRQAIGELSETANIIQKKVVERGKRNAFTRVLYARNDKDAIVTWGLKLDRILNVFNAELLVDIRCNISPGQEVTDDKSQSSQESVPLGEFPPPRPRACFGRDELIEKIVDLVENLRPIALIGPGGIGKTSVALAVLNSEPIKKRFGNNRRFIRCDKLSVSLVNFLNRLSMVIGAGVENPESLAPLRPFLSSKDMLIILDNAESILDPKGTEGQEFYEVVGELSRLDNVCLCITSRITTVPPDCKYLEVPTLSMDAARNTFYGIYENDERSGRIDKILQQLDFHPLSVTLLATVARENKWDSNRLVGEWEQRQTGMLQTGHESLAVTIKVSLASHMFQQLGPDALELLGVVAFFPQGIDEENLEWLFPTIPNRRSILDKFCALSLTYRCHGFITMLAPIRDNLYPKNPKESKLLSATKDLYIARLSVVDEPENGYARWIEADEMNVEHLLDALFSPDPNSQDIWDGCDNFLRHLFWHNPRHTAFRQKIQQLPDGHPWKPKGLFRLAGLYSVRGNGAEEKRLLVHTLKLWREQLRDPDRWIALALQRLADANRLQGHREEGIHQAEEALEVFEELGNDAETADCLVTLGNLFTEDNQFDAAEKAITRSITLLGKGEDPKFKLCDSHRVLGNVFYYKGEREKAIHQYNIALEIAERFRWHDRLFWTHDSLATLFRDENEFENAHTHIKLAKDHASGDEYSFGRAEEAHARIWYQQGKFEEAKSEVFGAIEIFEKLGAASHLERCKTLLQRIEQS